MQAEHQLAIMIYIATSVVAYRVARDQQASQGMAFLTALLWMPVTITYLAIAAFKR